MNREKPWLNKNILGFGLTSFFNDCSYEMTEAILPAFIEQLSGINAPIALGMIAGISNFASSIVKIISGIVTDKINRYKPILIFAYALTPFSVSLIGTTKHIWQIILYKTVGWMSKGIREPMRDTWITKIVSSNNYGQAFGFVRALDTIGGIIGPLIAYFSLNYFELNHIFLIAFIPGIFSVLALMLLTEEKHTNFHNSTYINWKKQLSNLPAHFNYFLIIMFVFGIGNYNKMLIVYRAQEMLLGIAKSYLIATSWAVLLYVFFNCIRAVSEYCIGTLSDYISRKNLLAVAGFGFFGISTLLQIFAKSNIFLWIIIFIFAAISTGTVKAVEKAYAASLLPENVRGTGFGILQMTDGIGDLISSVLVGFLWKTISSQAGFIYATALSIVSMVLLLLKNK